MSITKAIAEIDAYLLCLRQVRDLLRGSDRVSARPVRAQKQAGIRVAKKASATGTTAQTLKVQHQRESRERKPGPECKTVESVVIPVHSSSDIISAKQLMPIQSGILTPRDRQLPVGRNSTRKEGRRHHKQLQPIAGTETPKPANPLKSHTPFRVVVVSRDEAQKARKQAEPVVVTRSRTPTTPQSGRLAFEALFNDNAKSSVASSVK